MIVFHAVSAEIVQTALTAFFAKIVGRTMDAKSAKSVLNVTAVTTVQNANFVVNVKTVIFAQNV